MRKMLIRYVSYPLIMTAVVASQFIIVYGEISYWPLSPIIVTLGIVGVAVLERIQPYQVEWNDDHDDTLVDILHATFSLSLIFLTIEITAFTRQILPITSLWPNAAPLWLQIILAGLVIDFGLWLMHWWSHKSDYLWRLHALHHSSERLYWLNGERRHPLSAVLLASPGLFVVILLGAPPAVVGAWFAIVAVHLAFQHANLDYTVGPVRNIIGVAEVHRWHHKREFQDAQVNYGEFWMIWDQLFQTFRAGKNGVIAQGVGIHEPMPLSYVDQLKWPFSKISDRISSN